MNRPIKFRAWDTEKNEMIPVQGLVFDYEPPTVIENIGESYKEDDFVFMQFTGLTDKNGKEIYEGDILADSSTGETRGSVSWGGVDGFVVSNQSFRDIGMWEVIGNIYENPELLKI